MRLDQYDFEHFIRLQVELTARATKYFEARAKTFNNELRHELTKIEFHSDGCTISYKSSHCSNCSDLDNTDEIYVSLEDLLEFNEE